MPLSTKILAVPALIAALSLTATPVAAAELPVLRGDAPVQVTETSNYGGGWGRHRYRNRGRSTAGDVLGAVLVIGTIAAVANAATKAQYRRGYPYRVPAPAPYPYPDRRDYRPQGPRGVEGAADMCLREIERDARVDDVAHVERNASGWIVTGEMADGEGFTCTIDGDGRIERIEVGGRPTLPSDYEARSEGGRAESYRAPEVESDDDAPLRDYPAGAEAEIETQADDGPQPAYPGGPLPGDEDLPENDPV